MPWQTVDACHNAAALQASALHGKRVAQSIVSQVIINQVMSGTAHLNDERELVVRVVCIPGSTCSCGMSHDTEDRAAHCVAVQGELQFDPYVHCRVVFVRGHVPELRHTANQPAKAKANLGSMHWVDEIHGPRLKKAQLILVILIDCMAAKHLWQWSSANAMRERGTTRPTMCPRRWNTSRQHTVLCEGSSPAAPKQPDTP